MRARCNKPEGWNWCQGVQRLIEFAQPGSPCQFGAVCWEVQVPSSHHWCDNVDNTMKWRPSWTLTRSLASRSRPLASRLDHYIRLDMDQPWTLKHELLPSGFLSCTQSSSPRQRTEMESFSKLPSHDPVFVMISIDEVSPKKE